ncbi:MAG: glycine betaine ABC transporter substrate-binding protein [Bacillota bacterium]|nr:glycine betaine ABC transporter substrate-binding protein [Bacillota bacterium]
MTSRFKIIAVTLVALLTFFAVGCGDSGSAGDSGEPVKIGWARYTEQSILGYMTAILIEENLGIPTELSPDLGGTAVAHDAIIEGAIDVSVDYTGDALGNVLDLDPLPNPQEAYNAVSEGFKEKYDIVWLNPTEFNNTYALALKEEIAAERGIETISDLEPHAGEWTVGTSVEFSERRLDGYEGMVDHYGFSFGDIKPMDPGLMYISADRGDVDVIVAFATDARIGRFNLRVLEDNLEFFPAYNAAVTIRQETLDQYPEIADVVNEVFDGLDLETILELNGRVDIDEEETETVARDYLRDLGYID